MFKQIIFVIDTYSLWVHISPTCPISAVCWCRAMRFEIVRAQSCTLAVNDCEESMQMCVRTVDTFRDCFLCFDYIHEVIVKFPSYPANRRFSLLIISFADLAQCPSTKSLYSAIAWFVSFDNSFLGPIYFCFQYSWRVVYSWLAMIWSKWWQSQSFDSAVGAFSSFYYDHHYYDYRWKLFQHVRRYVEFRELCYLWFPVPHRI